MTREETYSFKCASSRNGSGERHLKYSIDFDPQVSNDLKAIRAHDRRAIMDTIERILKTNPDHIGKSRIKRLRGIDSSQYRLRVGDHRVFYNIAADRVYVMRILKKEDVQLYLAEMGYELEND